MEKFTKLTINRVIEDPLEIREILNGRQIKTPATELKPIEPDNDIEFKYPIVIINETPEKVPTVEEMLEAVKDNDRHVEIIKAYSDQRSALIQIYEDGNGKNWYHKDNWCTDADLDTWYGVTTETKLAFMFPDNSLVKVQVVTKLILNHNNAYCGKKQDNGRISPRIGDLTDLEILDLSYNFFQGNIPEDLYKLTKLRLLHLEFNQFEGGIDGRIGNLTKMEILHLDHNHLTGPIPDGIGNMTNLEGLYLHVNDLDNTEFRRRFIGELIKGSVKLGSLLSVKTPIPASIGSLTNLKTFYVYNNQLAGTIVDAIKNHPNYDKWHPDKFILPQQDDVMLD